MIDLLYRSFRWRRWQRRAACEEAFQLLETRHAAAVMHAHSEVNELHQQKAPQPIDLNLDDIAVFRKPRCLSVASLF